MTRVNVEKVPDSSIAQNFEKKNGTRLGTRACRRRTASISLVSGFWLGATSTLDTLYPSETQIRTISYKRISNAIEVTEEPTIHIGLIFRVNLALGLNFALNHYKFRRNLVHIKYMSNALPTKTSQSHPKSCPHSLYYNPYSRQNFGPSVWVMGYEEGLGYNRVWVKTAQSAIKFKGPMARVARPSRLHVFGSDSFQTMLYLLDNINGDLARIFLTS
ncbi:hypothetical protein C8J56DRAFT_889637 [Mycena floridula]|nr:hypothetical protein C8J56DRAFT_889637 [Mycena floridula]